MRIPIKLIPFSSRFAVVCGLALCLLFTGAVAAQSTATLQGTVTDATGASVPNATITIHNQSTGEERIAQTNDIGFYIVPSLPVGTYQVQVKAPGMQIMVVNDVVLDVGRTVAQDFTLKVAATSETIEISAAAPVVDTSTVSVGAVVNQRTVQEIPLNGRHFVDLALLIPGSVTPPQNGFLTAPLRGQGSFAFNSAGGREDSVNYMINGINMSDPVQNQITFQPTINTVGEFKVDNSTFPAEYGRNSGSIVNIATRSGTNEWHGEAYEFLRNSYFDARNFVNTKETGPSGALVSNPQSPFKRNQFGGDGGGYIKKDKTFFYLSYEGLRQRQAVPLTSTVLTDTQRAQALATERCNRPEVASADSGGERAGRTIPGLRHRERQYRSGHREPEPQLHRYASHQLVLCVAGRSARRAAQHARQHAPRFRRPPPGAAPDHDVE